MTKGEASLGSGEVAGLLDLLSDSIVVIEPDGVIRYWNAAASERFGFSAEEAIGQIGFRLLRTEFPSPRGEIVDRVLTHGSWEGTITHRHRDGARLTATSRWVRRGTGRDFTIVQIHRDLTATEQALHRSEERFRLATEALASYLVDWDIEAKVVHRSEGFERLLGYAPTSETHHPDWWPTIIHPDDRERAMRELREAFESDAETFRLQYRVRHADGGYRHMSDRGRILRNSEGKAVRMVGGKIDITARVRDREALLRSEAKFESLFEVFPHIVWMTDEHGNAEYGNRRLYEYVGMSPQEFANDGWKVAIHPDDLPRSLARESSAVEGGRAREGFVRMRRALDGAYRWFYSTRAPMEDGEGRVHGWIGCLVDVDDQRRAEERLEEAVRERTRELTESLAEREAIMYSVAHDLRAPLRSIVATCRILRDEFSDELSSDAVALLERQQTAAKRLAEQIDAVLKIQIVTRQEPAVEPVELSAIARRVADELLTQDWPQPLSFEIQDGLVDAADPQLIGLVLQNLLENACKYSPAGGRIAFGRRPDGAYFVSDEGIGFDPVYLEKIFRPFERLHRADEFPGTGIGLSLVERIVHRHEGRIWAESQPGQGATFLFTLG